MKSIKLIPTLGACAALFFTANLNAAVVASYIFDGGVLTSNDTNLQTTASAITGGSGATLTTSGTNLTAPDLALNVEAIAITNSLAAAVTNNVFFTFTITPEMGNSVSYGILDGLVRRSATSSTRGWQLRSSLTGSTVLAEDTSITAARTGAMESLTPSTGSLDLSSVTALQNVTSAVTFTFFANTGTGDPYNGGRTVEFNNLTLNATVIPEPSSALLLGVASLGLLRRKR